MGKQGGRVKQRSRKRRRERGVTEHERDSNNGGKSSEPDLWFPESEWTARVDWERGQSVYIGDGLAPVPSKLANRINKGEYIDMCDLLPELWITL